jgi:hypothetical protein
VDEESAGDGDCGSPCWLTRVDDELIWLGGVPSPGFERNPKLRSLVWCGRALLESENIAAGPERVGPGISNGFLANDEDLAFLQMPDLPDDRIGFGPGVLLLCSRPGSAAGHE